MDEYEILVFETEDGTELKFDMLDELDYDGNHYFALGPKDDVFFDENSGIDPEESYFIFEQLDDDTVSEVCEEELAAKLSEIFDARFALEVSTEDES